jgi:hypothetical protein
MIGIAYNSGVVMPGAELATLEGILATIDASEAIELQKNAENN